MILRVSNDMKYHGYHVIVLVMFIITCFKLCTNPDKFTIFVLFVILIQIILYCGINTSNTSLHYPPVCYLLIAFTTVSVTIVFIPYIFITLINIENLYVSNIIYFVCMSFYILTVIYLINWYYLSGTKYEALLCFCCSRRLPTNRSIPPKNQVVIVNLPTIPIDFKSESPINNSSCTICYEPYGLSRVKTTLSCNHILCSCCLTVLDQEICPFCRSNIK